MDQESSAAPNQNPHQPVSEGWTRLEKAELALIPLFAGLIAISSTHFLPSHVSAGEAVLYGSGALLFQSLVRDLSLLSAATRAAQNEPKRYESCFCLESTLGLTGILLGIGLLFSAWTRPIQMTPIHWSSAVLAIGVLGFIVKDYVIRWSPWAIAKDKDHLNLVVRL